MPGVPGFLLSVFRLWISETLEAKRTAGVLGPSPVSLKPVMLGLRNSHRDTPTQGPSCLPRRATGSPLCSLQCAHRARGSEHREAVRTLEWRPALRERPGPSPPRGARELTKTVRLWRAGSTEGPAVTGNLQQKTDDQLAGTLYTPEPATPPTRKHERTQAPLGRPEASSRWYRGPTTGRSGGVDRLLCA